MDHEHCDELKPLDGLEPPAAAKKASDLLDHYQAVIERLSDARREAVRVLAGPGWEWSQQRIADHLKVTRGRVQQLLGGGNITNAERVVLGTSDLTVAVGGKWEAVKASGPQEVVVSVGMQGAFDLIATAARALGLDVTCEIVPPPGRVNLNRDNLIVIGSPRILRRVDEALEADPHLGFAEGPQGWYLTENSHVHRSPSDTGQPTDYAYVGRLPRLDGSGTFLYLAGIHAAGTLGAARWLTENLASIHARVKNRRWSVLISATYDPATRAINTTYPLTEIYVH